MKADIIHALKGHTVLAVPGVNALSELEKSLLILKENGTKHIMTAFDMDISAHILRHTSCTLYARARMDIKALQSIMGHQDASITMNIYNHADDEHTRDEISRLNNVINF